MVASSKKNEYFKGYIIVFWEFCNWGFFQLMDTLSAVTFLKRGSSTSVTLTRWFFVVGSRLCTAGATNILQRLPPRCQQQIVVTIKNVSRQGQNASGGQNHPSWEPLFYSNMESFGTLMSVVLCHWLAFHIFIYQAASEDHTVDTNKYHWPKWIKPSQQCMSFLKFFKVETTTRFPMWTSSAKENKPTNQRQNWLQERKCRMDIIANNPIWETSLKIIYVPFSCIHFPPEALKLCINVCKLCFLHGYKLWDPIYLYWEVKTEAIINKRYTKIMVLYPYYLGQIFVKNLNWSSLKWVRPYIPFHNSVIEKKKVLKEGRNRRGKITMTIWSWAD